MTAYEIKTSHVPIIDFTFFHTGKNNVAPTPLNKGVFGVRHVSVSDTDTTPTHVFTVNLLFFKIINGVNVSVLMSRLCLCPCFTWKKSKREKKIRLGKRSLPCQGKHNKQIKTNNATKLLNPSANLSVYY